MVARLHGMEEAESSNLFRSTPSPSAGGSSVQAQVGITTQSMFFSIREIFLRGYLKEVK